MRKHPDQLAMGHPRRRGTRRVQRTRLFGATPAYGTYRRHLFYGAGFCFQGSRREQTTLSCAGIVGSFWGAMDA